MSRGLGDVYKRQLQDIKERVQLITVPGQNGVEKEDVIIGYQITAPNGDVYAVFVNADDKAREFTLGTTFAHLRKAEVLADENQAGPVGIANPQGLEWTEKGLKLNALTAVVLRLSQGGAIVAPVVEEKPEFDLSSLEVEPEQGQAQDLAANPETQETAAEAHSQNLLPNTGTESKSLLALAGFSILALLGLGWLIKNKKKN